jgi:tetratricopeptide (TPR) repeat protein
LLDPDAVRLAKELDGLPLALATAGAYLDQTARSFSDYLRLYKESWVRLMETSPELSSYEDRTLYSTWQISFDSIKQRNPLSADLLRLWAYFDNQDLWFELLRHGDSKDPGWLRELTKDELSFDGAVRVLSNHGLVNFATSSHEWLESKGYSIHGCVHSWTIHALNQEWNYDLARLALKFVGAHVPGEYSIRPWLTQRRLLQHATRCSYMLSNNLVQDNDIAWECHRLGLLYANQGKLVEAEQMYQRALQGKEKALGPEHTSTLDTVNNLGLLYADQGKLVEAEQMYQRALQGKEKALGPEHTSTLDTVNNLGLLYADQGKLVEAEQMYQRALQGYEKVLGLDNIITHLQVLNTIFNLGSLFERQADIGKARLLYSKALIGYDKVFGPGHLKSQFLRDKFRAFDTITKNEALKDVAEDWHNSDVELRLDERADIGTNDDTRIGNEGRMVANSDSGYASGTYRPCHTLYTIAESRLAIIAEPSESQEHVGLGYRADDPDPPDIGLYNTDTAYSPSETPSLPPLRSKIYIDDLASQLFRAVVSQKPDQETLDRVSQELPDLLRAFSLKIGYRATPTQCHVAYFLHKNRGYVR